MQIIQLILLNNRNIISNKLSSHDKLLLVSRA